MYCTKSSGNLPNLPLPDDSSLRDHALYLAGLLLPGGNADQAAARKRIERAAAGEDFEALVEAMELAQPMMNRDGSRGVATEPFRLWVDGWLSRADGLLEQQNELTDKAA